MRELKFRAFDGKSMRYDVTGFEHGKENEMAGVFLDGDYYVITDDINSDHDQFNPVAVVMQFAGLKDKNGKDIYEGDIVRTKAKFGTSGRHPKKTGEYIETVAQVLFTEDGAFTYREPDWQYRKRIDLGNSTDWYRSYCWLKECEVIGNIHENPELMEQSS